MWARIWCSLYNLVKGIVWVCTVLNSSPNRYFGFVQVCLVGYKCGFWGLSFAFFSLFFSYIHVLRFELYTFYYLHCMGRGCICNLRSELWYVLYGVTSWFKIQDLRHVLHDVASAIWDLGSVICISWDRICGLRFEICNICFIKLHLRFKVWALQHMLHGVTPVVWGLGSPTCTSRCHIRSSRFELCVPLFV